MSSRASGAGSRTSRAWSAGRPAACGRGAAGSGRRRARARCARGPSGRSGCPRARPARRSRPARSRDADRDPHLERGRQDERAHAERVRAHRRDHDRLEAGRDHRSPGRQRVRGRARGAGGDQAVGDDVAEERLPRRHVEAQRAVRAVRLDHDVVERDAEVARAAALLGLEARGEQAPALARRACPRARRSSPRPAPWPRTRRGSRGRRG